MPRTSGQPRHWGANVVSSGSLNRATILTMATAFIVSLVLIATTVAPSANAAGETLNIELKAVTGTANFDADDAPGHDSSPSNLIIRTNDIITYTTAVVANGGVADNTVVTLTIPRGQEFTQIPSYCQGGTLSPAIIPALTTPITATSWLSLPASQTITCPIGRLANPGTTVNVDFQVRQRVEVPNGTVSPTATANIRSAFVTTPVAAPQQLPMTVSAAPKWDVSKNSINTSANTGYFYNAWRACSFDATQACFYTTWNVLVSSPDGGKGTTPLEGPVTFADVANSASYFGPTITSSPAWVAAGANANNLYGVRLVSCGQTSLYSGPGYQVGAGGTAETAVRKSGTLACTQPGGAGTDINMTLTNTDWSLYTSPIRMTNPVATLPDNRAYAVSLQMGLEVPRRAWTDLARKNADGSLTLHMKNEYANFTATGLGGIPQAPGVEPTWNNTREWDTTLTPPGGFSKYFVGVPGEPLNTPPVVYAPGSGYSEGLPGGMTLRSGSIPVSGGQRVISMLQQSGTHLGNSSPGTSFQCDTWDNTKMQLTKGNVPATSYGVAGQKFPSNGEAAWISGINQAPNSSVVPGVFQYSGDVPAGNGAASGCKTGTWYDRPEDVPGNDPTLAAQGIFSAVNRVRALVQIPQPTAASGNFVIIHTSILLTVVPGQAEGAIQPNWASVQQHFGSTLPDMATAVANTTDSVNLSTYNPATHGGVLGDRLIFAPAFARIDKTVSKAGGAFSKVVAATGGETVTWRLQPRLSTAGTTKIAQPVTIEDCLPVGLTFLGATLGGNPITPSVAQAAPAPAGSEITCTTGTYVRFAIGNYVPNAAIPALDMQTRIASTATPATYRNLTTIQTSPKDPTPLLTTPTADGRSSYADVTIQQLSGAQIDKTPLTPVTQVNRLGSPNTELNRWSISLAYLSGAGGGAYQNPDMIDVLPTKTGVNGSTFSGTMEFVDVQVTKGSTAAQPVQVLYTSAPTINPDANDATNGAAGIAWCSAPAGGTLVSGAGACPASAAEVTGLRLKRAGAFVGGNEIAATVQMRAIGNKSGDTYVNVTASRLVGGPFLLGPREAPERAVSSSIGDKVWVDVNRNGLQDAGEAGYAGLTVRLNGTDDLGNAVALTTTTDAQGAYLFDGLRAGTYTVTFDPAGLKAGESFTTQGAGNDRTVDSDGAVATGVTAPITLASGVARTDIDQGVVVPLGSIGDRVWRDADRDGVQDAGEPGYAGLTVTLTGTDVYGNPVTRTAVTDANGAYLFDNLVAGSCTVTFDPAQLPAGFILSPNTGSDPATNSDGDPATGRTPAITLTPGENRTDIDQGIIAQVGSLGDKVWVDLNGNGIQDTGEPGYAGLTVRLTGTDVYGNSVTRTTTTDAQGAYLFANLDEGTYTVTFDPAGLKSGESFTTAGAGSDRAADSDGDATTGATAPITLGPGVSNLTIDQGVRMAPSSIGDKVWRDADGDGVQDAGEPGYPGLTVTLTGTDVFGNPVSLTTTTGPNGEYLFPNLLPGTYEVTFDPSQLPAGLKLSPNSGSDSATNSDGDPVTGKTAAITLGAGESRTDIDQGIAANPSSIGDKVWIDLNGDGVQDAGEPGYPGLTVRLTGTDEFGNPVSLTTTTDANGAYLFDNLAPGTYTVTFDPAGLKSGESFTTPGAGADRAADSDGDATTGATAPVTLGPGVSNLTIDQGVRMAPSSIGDRVWRDADGDGVQDAGEPGYPGLTVTLTGTDVFGNPVSLTTMTDANGAYLFPNLLPGSYVVTFDPAQLPAGLTLSPNSGSDPATNSDGDPVNGRTPAITLGAGENRTDIDQGIAANPSSIGDRVWIDTNGNGIHDPGERGYAGLTVLLTGTDEFGNPVSLTTTTDANGAYLFDNLAPGTYTVTFDPAGLKSGEKLSTPGAGSDRAADSDGDATTGATAPITLGPGVRVTDIDQGVIPAPAPPTPTATPTVTPTISPTTITVPPSGTAPTTTASTGPGGLPNTGASGWIGIIAVVSVALLGLGALMFDRGRRAA